MSERLEAYSLDQPVFVQGLFRSRTTFLVAEFGRDSRNILFNEPLHPSFGQTGQELPQKTLRHPKLEESYLAKLPENIHVPVDLGVKRYYLKPTDEEPEIEHYINQLIISTDNKPIFKFVRMALRGEWLAKKFQGVHLYIDRDLSGLINSYYSYHGWYSWYLSEFVTIVGANAEHTIFGELADYMNLKKTDGTYQELRNYYGKLAHERFKDGQYTKQTMVDMIAFFRELSLIQANKYAKIIRPEDLRNGDRRNKIAEELTQLTGTTIDFSNYKDKQPKKLVEPSVQVLTIIENAKSKIEHE